MIESLSAHDEVIVTSPRPLLDAPACEIAQTRGFINTTRNIITATLRDETHPYSLRGAGCYVFLLPSAMHHLADCDDLHFGQPTVGISLRSSCRASSCHKQPQRPRLPCPKRPRVALPTAINLSDPVQPCFCRWTFCTAMAQAGVGTMEKNGKTTLGGKYRVGVQQSVPFCGIG